MLWDTHTHTHTHTHTYIHIYIPWHKITDVSHNKWLWDWYGAIGTVLHTYMHAYIHTYIPYHNITDAYIYYIYIHTDAVGLVRSYWNSA